MRQLSYKYNKLLWERKLFFLIHYGAFISPDASLSCALTRTRREPDGKILVFHVEKKSTALKSANISKEGHIKSVKTAQSSNWIFCPRPARSRFSLHGAPKTLQALQKSCEPFSSPFYAAFYSSTSLAGSNKAKADESFEVTTFSEKQN